MHTLSIKKTYIKGERGTEFIAIKHLSDRTWVFYNDFEVFHGNSVSEKIEWNGFVAQVCFIKNCKKLFNLRVLFSKNAY